MTAAMRILGDRLPALHRRMRKRARTAASKRRPRRVTCAAPAGGY